EHGSAEVLAYGAIAGMLPAAIIGPFAGIYIDRWNRKKTMMFADGFVALCTLVMSISFYLGYESLLLIYAMLALRPVGLAFHLPALQASIVRSGRGRERWRIAGATQMSRPVSGIAGRAVGALGATLRPIGNVLLLEIAGAAVALVWLLFVYIPAPG